MSTYKYPVVLSIAGSDSGGGAGIQADLKTISALGCFGSTAITAITVQNTLGVSSMHPIPVDFVRAQIKAVITDLKPLAIKIGMVHSADLAAGIFTELQHYKNIPVIFDPVMVATSGYRLVENNIMQIFKDRLFPLCEIVTPNLEEAGVLAQMEVKTIDDMKEAALRIIKYGPCSVLIKGGHLKGPGLVDVYLDKHGDEHVFESVAINTINTHGTGCSLSSAIACYIALGHNLKTAILKSKQYVHQAIEQGKDVKTGAGNGPLNHFFDPQKLIKFKMNQY